MYVLAENSATVAKYNENKLLKEKLAREEKNKRAKTVAFNPQEN